jgi:hypothetical protein
MGSTSGAHSTSSAAGAGAGSPAAAQFTCFTSTKVQILTPALLRQHIWSPLHQQRLRHKSHKPSAEGGANEREASSWREAKSASGRRRVVVMIDPLAHHSALLPFRELARQFPIKKGGHAVFPARRCTQFTCFSGTKVQILTPAGGLPVSTESFQTPPR